MSEITFYRIKFVLDKGSTSTIPCKILLTAPCQILITKSCKKVLDIYKHLRLVILNSVTIDCRNGDIDPMSMAFLQMAGVFSELELSMVRARVRSGMANAKAKGKQIGRRPITKADLPAVFIKYYSSYADGSMTVTELARICGLSRPTIYKYIRTLVI